MNMVSFSTSGKITVPYHHITIVRLIETLLRSLSARCWMVAIWRTCGMSETQQYTWTAPLEQLHSPDMLIIKRASMPPLSHLHGNSRGHGSRWHQVADRRDKREKARHGETDQDTEREDFGSSYVCGWVLNQVCPIPQRKTKPVHSDQDHQCCHLILLF